jgi:hypothetical protein
MSCKTMMCALAWAACAFAACAPLPPPTTAEIPAVPLPACTPNLDGIVEAAELPFAVGALAYVRVGTNVEVNTAGEPAREGRLWDLSRPSAQTEPQGSLRLLPLEEQWFGDEFPGATLAGALAPENGIMGALELSNSAVYLHGAASKEEEPAEGKTLIVYQEPVPLYEFPLELGNVTSHTTRATGAFISGIPTAFEDVTTIEVTSAGTVILPDFEVERALRITIRLVRTPVAGIAAQQTTHVFVAECVGEVARMVSPLVPVGTPLADEFTTAAEVWRVSF